MYIIFESKILCIREHMIGLLMINVLKRMILPFYFAVTLTQKREQVPGTHDMHLEPGSNMDQAWGHDNPDSKEQCDVYTV